MKHNGKEYSPIEFRQLKAQVAQQVIYEIKKYCTTLGVIKVIDYNNVPVCTEKKIEDLVFKKISNIFCSLFTQVKPNEKNLLNWRLMIKIFFTASSSTELTLQVLNKINILKQRDFYKKVNPYDQPDKYTIYKDHKYLCINENQQLLSFNRLPNLNYKGS